MITLALPDKWVRKAIYDLCNGQVVDGQAIPVFDYRTAGNFPDRYVRILDQSSQSAATTKCGWRWVNTTIIEAFYRYASGGNQGSRLAADDIAQMVLTQLQAYDLDPASNLNLVRYQVSTLTDFLDDDGRYITTSKILSLTSVIN